MKKLGLLSLCFLTVFAYSQTWQDVGGGTNNSSHGMLVYDGKLINLGSFNNPCNRVAAWDGSTWSCLSGGVGIVARAGCVWDGKLVVVGDFWNNFQPCPGCNGVAVWDGTTWSALDQGFNNDVLTCTVHDGELYIGGDFTAANGVPINRVAKWDTLTNSFVSVGNVTAMDNDVRCMVSYDGQLWVGGDFNNVDGCSPCDGLVKWDDVNQVWEGGNSGVDLVGGVNETVRVLFVNPGDGNLYMGGHFPELIDGDVGVMDFNMSGIAMYDGSNWFPLGTGLNEYCRAIHHYNGYVIAGGYFTDAGGVAANKIAKWDPVNQTWSAMGLGFDGVGIDEYVKSAYTWNGIFFAGGAYTQAEGGPMNYIAQWYEAPTNPPLASINASTTAVCEGGCIDFMDNSTNSPTSWSWTFPGSDTPTSTAQNPGSVCYSTAGSYTVSLQACNANGCNTTTMTINIETVPTVTVSDQTICEGNTATLTAVPSAGGGNYNWSPGGQTTSSINVSPASTTTYTVNYDLNGCPAVPITATVTVNPVPTVSVNSETICEGDMAILTAAPSVGGGTYNWSSGQTTSSITVSPTITTVYDVDYTLNGCTSPIAQSIVQVNPTYALNEAAEVCSGNSITYPDGFTETITGPTSHTSNLTTIDGCDSIITTNVTLGTPYNLSESVEVCTGSNYTYPDGTVSTNITAPESHTSNLTSSAGCDSVITTNVSLGTSYNLTEAVQVCSGASYTYPDGTVSTGITASESHISNLLSTAGCDSVITTNISVISSYNLTESANVCSGDSYTYPDGSTSVNITAAESHVSNLTAVNGCDSTITTNVTITALPLNTVTVSGITLTADEVGAAYQWLDCDNNYAVINGETNQTFTPIANGNYAVDVTLNGCSDTSDCRAINSIGFDEESIQLSIYPNPVNGELMISSSVPVKGVPFEILDARGRVVLEGMLSENIISVQQLERGAYILQLDHIHRIRFIKQ